MNDNEYIDAEEELAPPDGEPIGEPVSGGSVPDTGSLNSELPRMVAQVVFQSAPTSLLPVGQAATQASNDAERYVNLTSPILRIVRYDQCLGGVGELSPTARLIIGSAALLLGAVIIKLPTLAKGKKDGKRDAKMDAGGHGETQSEDSTANV